MSFSFTAKGATTADAKAAVAAELDKVVENQPIHAKDRDAAQATADDYIDLLGEPGEGKVCCVSVNGNVGWTGEGDDKVITHVGGGISCSFIDAEVEAAPEAEAEVEAAPAPEPEPA